FPSALPIGAVRVDVLSGREPRAHLAHGRDQHADVRLARAVVENARAQREAAAYHRGGQEDSPFGLRFRGAVKRRGPCGQSWTITLRLTSPCCRRSKAWLIPPSGIRREISSRSLYVPSMKRSISIGTSVR